MRVLFLLLLLVTTASARIGETMQQCEARYGKSTQNDGFSYSFKKGGFLVMVSFYKGKADFIAFEKLGQNAGSITPDEIKTLLADNGTGRIWKPVKGAPAFVAWETTDKELIAHYGVQTFTLTIYTRASAERDEADLKKPLPNAVPKGF